MMIKQTSRDGGGSLFQRLESGMEQFMHSERTIANFLLGNRQLIAFESAASLAEKLQISPATVGRFCRRIGYRPFKALKADLKINAAGVPALGGEELSNSVTSGPDETNLKPARTE